MERSTVVGRQLGPLLRLGLLALLLPALIVAFVASNGSALAQSTGATINVFCLDFQKAFPEGQTIKAQGLVNDKIRTALAYAESKGYVTSDPYEVQLAVWNLQDGQPFHDTQNKGTTIAQDIVSHASGTPPSADTSALSNLTLTNIHQASPQAAYGTATIQGSVNTNGLPVGFLLPASASNFQSLVAVVSSGSAQQASSSTSSSSTSATSSSASSSTASSSTASTTQSSATTVTTTSVSTSTHTSATVSALPSTGGGGMATRSSAWGLGLLGLLAAMTGATVVATSRRR